MDRTAPHAHWILDLLWPCRSIERQVEHGNREHDVIPHRRVV